ncbi:hypothetical protein M0208_05880 [Sphingomonas sp. SUN019]|uniref:hypothetical protein n=1 Tax=Sphingomonas sp. SUN019 TaxID=2937788 RepID=UPI002164081E|nr:hypothetical protein [Sphingomonas sp. SUN019]UVO50071.1 hypothetical protein M0208_05880 [Sphingomonas sp. SUN019]
MSGALAKLGWKPGMTLRGYRCPPELAETLADTGTTAEPDILIAFVPDRAAVAEAFAWARLLYRRGARLWFAYPKKSGARASDISRDAGWEELAAAGYLPVTQVALDADWSALRFRERDEIPKLTRASERGAA